MTKAIIENRVNDVQALLVKNPEQANAQDAKGFPALVIAASCGQAAVSRVLLDAGAKIDALDREGLTALHRAAKNGYADCVKLLVSRGANIHIKEPSGQLTPEGMARTRNHPDLADFLKGVADGTVSPGGPSGLVLAIGRGDLAQVESMLKATPALAGQPDSAGRTPLHVAMTGKSEIAACLMAQNADVNKADTNNWRPLHIAAEAGRADMVKLLLEHAADPNAAAAQGAQTPLYIATLYGFTEVVKNLLAAQANPNLNTSQGISPLHRAAENGHIDIVSLLLLAKADVNGKDQAGRTALDYAVAANRRDVIALLQKFGAVGSLPVPASPAGTAAPGRKADPNATLDPAQAKELLDACLAYDGDKIDALLKANPDLAYARDTSNYTALHFLSFNPRKGTPELAKKFLDLGVPVDIPSSFKRTPLMRAAEMGNLQLVKFYLEQGANVNAADGANWSPLWAAAHAGTTDDHVEIVRVLLDHKADSKVRDLNENLTPYGTAKKESRLLILQALESRGIKE